MLLNQKTIERIKEDAETYTDNQANHFLDDNDLSAYKAGATSEAERSLKLIEALDKISNAHPDGNPVNLINIAKQAIEDYSK